MLKRNAVLALLLICGLPGVLGVSFGAPVAVAQESTGVIAYVRGGNELRLINPDGTGDRTLWTAPGEPVPPLTISDLDWSPDSSALAFASAHERASSLFEHDIYTIRPDGSGLRKLTNGPTLDQLAHMPKGTVTVRIDNGTLSSPLLVYVAGAPGLQAVTAGPGGSQLVTFNDVADFGQGAAQGVVAIFGPNRWFRATAVDVQPSATVHAGSMLVAGGGARSFGGYAPSWHSDGLRVGFLQGCGALKDVPADAGPGNLGVITTAPNVSGVICLADWGPGPAHANKVLYTEQFVSGNIYLTTEGSRDAGELLVSFSAANPPLELEWLPDGSGFVYVLGTDFDGSTWQTGNLQLYRFASRTSTPLTDFSGDLVRGVSFSADGQSLVFAREDSFGGPSDLWIMGSDGSNPRLLVRNASTPAWSQGTPRLPERVFLPFTRR